MRFLPLDTLTCIHLGIYSKTSAIVFYLLLDFKNFRLKSLLRCSEPVWSTFKVHQNLNATRYSDLHTLKNLFEHQRNCFSLVVLF